MMFYISNMSDDNEIDTDIENYTVEDILSIFNIILFSKEKTSFGKIIINNINKIDNLFFNICLITI